VNDPRLTPADLAAVETIMAPADLALATGCRSTDRLLHDEGARSGRVRVGDGCGRGGARPDRDVGATPHRDDVDGGGRAVIGLLLLTEHWQRQGLGRAFARLVEQTIGGWPEIERFRIGVISTNPGALAFWRKLGYVETGEVKPGAPDFRGDIIVLEKPLVRATVGAP